MDQSAIVAATITWARNDSEEQLLLRSIKVLAQEKEIPTIITDATSAENFRAHLGRVPNCRVTAAHIPDVWAQTKSSLMTACSTKAKFILYTESDKELFFSGALQTFITAAPDTAALVFPARSTPSLRTFPESQIYTEGVINELCSWFVGVHADFSYGPILINRRLIPYLSLLPDDVGWGWRFFLYGIAARLGLELFPIVDDLVCPDEQRANTRAEQLHRMKQLQQNIQGLLHSQVVSDLDIESVQSDS